MDLTGLAKDVLLALATGVVASGMYEYLVARRKANFFRDTFQALQGDYREKSWREGGPQEPTGGVIRLKYCGSNKLKTEGITSNGQTLWHGELFMREDAHVLGAGFYSYNEEHDVGFHEVIHDPNIRSFYVTGENRSHPGRSREFKMIWERID